LKFKKVKPSEDCEIKIAFLKIMIIKLIVLINSTIKKVEL